ncbi:cyclin-domain-containing protein [Patellaria atrata CBS 101060]|uniref:Cyclin-domain-containing protein n=1 Tax=Patellaria atrata CBS 101060 TaxID=1346257 RepID=A0A9P4VVE6_9PEZI|nr:cyclin-domain-containing protein [Patellaria atrata CBS 101060]
MFGGNAHQQPHESPTASYHGSSSSSRTYESTNPHIRVPHSNDTPMTDAVSHTSTHAASAGFGAASQQQQNSSLQPTNLTPHDPSPSAHSRRPPPSPRFKPHSQAHTPNSSAQPGTPYNTSTYPPSSHGPQSPINSATTSPPRIKVKSLAHIQSFAVDESSPFSQAQAAARRARGDPSDIGPQYEISEMPVTDIIEMVAGLLTKITTTNDRQHEHIHRQIPPPEGTSGLSQQTTSVLAFHGKNVPTISILSYLSRIHKYCPTTYEVFLALLVYFDRMTERVNSGPLQSLRRATEAADSGNAHDRESRHSSISTASVGEQERHAASEKTQIGTPPPSGSLGKPAEPRVTEDKGRPPSPPHSIEPPLESDPYNLSQFFVVDSFNIHRLVIAGVTCASKFFSDIFYTNSRYAKVGGLPLTELNHLELQFLLLNDFRLSVPLDEMEAYGTMLVEFYAREVVAQHAQYRSNGSYHRGSPGISA